MIIKKVNFADANDEHDFMKFLKPAAATTALSTLQTPNKEEYNDSEPSLKEMLREILNNQTKILALLQKNNI